MLFNYLKRSRSIHLFFLVGRYCSPLYL